jgi:hypothetical protein
MKTGTIIGKVQKVWPDHVYEVEADGQTYAQVKDFRVWQIGAEVRIGFLNGSPELAFITGAPDDASARLNHEKSKVGRVLKVDGNKHDVLISDHERYDELIVDSALSSASGPFPVSSSVIVALRGEDDEPYLWGASPWSVGI